ncbi:hypothetical protein MRX96_058792 [Rhipicephalus microplus]
MARWPVRSGSPENGGTTIRDPKPREVRKEPAWSGPEKGLSRVKYERNRAVKSRGVFDLVPREVRKEPRGRVGLDPKPRQVRKEQRD